MTGSSARGDGLKELVRGVCLGAVVSLPGTASGQTPPEGLAGLIHQYQAVSSLHFSATGEIVMGLPCDCQIEGPEVELSAPFSGLLEYWAEGERYFIRSWAEPDKYPGVQTEVAWDGQQFQLLLSSGTLSVSSVNSNALLPVLPNPLLELLQFRYPVTDQSYGTELELQWKDVQQDVVPAGFWRVKWAPVVESGQKLERATFPGGTYEGREYVHHVFVLEGARNRPVRIDRVGPEGRMTSTEFSDYRRLDTASGPTFWPQKIVLRAFDHQGAPVGFISFVLTDLAVNVDFADEVFTIPPDRALSVWDDDQARFLDKEPSR